MSEWQTIDEGIQTYEYAFGPGRARTFAVKGPKGWIVIGPAFGADDRVFDALTSQAPIAAIVAPNAFHNMGIHAWHERFPEAKLFAPAQSIARVEKKGKVTNVAPVADAKDLCGDAIELVDIPHYKTGEVLVKVKAPSGPIWHVTDLIFNFPTLPPGLFVKILFTWFTDSAPGFKLSGLAAFLQMKDKKGVYRWLKEEAQKAPPVRVVPSHGVDEVLDPPGAKLLEILTTQGKV